MSNVAPRDARLHGAYGDIVVHVPSAGELEEKKQEAASRPNVQLYLKKIKEPNNLTKIRRQGCSGWPCQQGYLCDFCVLRPEWTAEAKADKFEAESEELRKEIKILREQQANVETLRRAEKMVSGKHWSQVEENRLESIGNLVQDSKARLEAISSTRAKIAAETARDGLMQQLTAMQERMNIKERQLSEANQRVEALQQTLSVCQRDLKTASEEIKNKRVLMAEAFKEKSRFAQEVMRAESRVAVQDQELAIKAEQVKKLIVKLQELQAVGEERDKYKEIADKRAGLAQGVMDQVAIDLVFAERIRDEHVTTVKKLTTDNQRIKRSMTDQQTVVAKLRTQVQDLKAKEANASIMQAALERRQKLEASKSKSRR